MGILSKYLLGAMGILFLATVLLTRYSFSLKANLAIATDKYDVLYEYSIKQSVQLEEERKSNAELNTSYKRLDKAYAKSKKEVEDLKDVDGCLDESDVTILLCGKGILGGTACPVIADSPGTNK